MKLDKICRVCLLEKADMKPLFRACVANMLMSCASVQVIQGDGLPNQICLQCLQSVNRAYSFKQLCEKSDETLRQYVSNIQLHSVSSEQNLMDQMKADQLFTSSEVLQQSSLLQDIFSDATNHSLVDNFSSPANNVVSDLAETMQSLQTIAEQCLVNSWEADTQLVSCHSNSDTTCSTLLHSTYKCQFCEEIFKDEWTLGDHMKSHTGQSKYFCAICGKGCNTTEALSEHSIEHSINQGEPLCIPKKSVIKNHVCSLCDKGFDEAKHLKKHLKDVHFFDINVKVNSVRHTCNICGKSYKQNKFLISHMRCHTGERPLSCELCGKTFALQSSLYKHRKIHIGEKRYECTICGRKFSQSSNLNTHLTLHTGVKPYICSICNKGFSSNVNLKVHMRIHTGEKPFKCPSCPSSFTTNSQLKKHIRKHTGEKPYQCWHCGKSFREKETRDTHVRYHTGERPYTCVLCPKKYIAADHLRVHMKAHKNERHYQCSICLKKFRDLKTLRSHINIHTGQKMYSCKYCCKTFIHSGSLSTHLKNIHKENENSELEKAVLDLM